MALGREVGWRQSIAVGGQPIRRDAAAVFTTLTHNTHLVEVPG